MATWTDVADADIDDKSPLKTTTATRMTDNIVAGYENMRHMVIRANNTDIVNDNVLNTDAELKFTAGALETWWLKFVLFITTTANADFKLSVTGFSGYYFAQFSDPVPVTGTSYWMFNTAGAASTMNIATTITELPLYVYAYVTSGGGMDLGIQWAQGNSHADTTSVLGYSTMEAWRVSDLTSLSVPSSYVSVPASDVAITGRWDGEDGVTEDLRANNIYLSHGTREGAYKSAGETVAANPGDTPQDDDDLQFTVEAGATYQFSMRLAIITTAALDWHYKFVLPSLGTGTYMTWTSRYSGETGGVSQAWASTHALDNPTADPGRDISYTLAAGELIVWLDGVFTVGDTGGTFKLQWCKGTGGAGNTTVLAGSHGMLWRMNPIATL